MNDDLTTQVVINNEYDYSNILPTVDTILYLVQYCDQMYKQLVKLVNDDEEKNKELKQDYKKYMYKKSYSRNFEVYIREKGFNSITCNNYEAFVTAANNGNLNHVLEIKIELRMDFERGQENDFSKHENNFRIIFKPYEITFIRKSNYNDPSMTQIENQINEILKRFPVANSVFCTK